MASLGNYWIATRRAPLRLAPPAGTRKADVVVVGGGLLGLSAALGAAGRGARVVLLEAFDLGWGASGRNAGFVVPNFAKVDPDRIVATLGEDRGERLIRLVGGSADLVFDTIRRHGIECDARQDGWMQPAVSEAQLQTVGQRAAQWRARGKPVEVIDGAQVAARAGCDGYAGAWIDPSGGTLHPLGYVDGLARAAAAAGAELYTGAPVRGMSRQSDRWVVTAGDGATVEAASVLVCTNAYGALRPRLSRSLIPLTIHQIATEVLPADVLGRLFRRGECLSDVQNDLFTYRVTPDGRLISGGMAAFGWGADARMARRITLRLAEMLNLPEVPRAEYVWSGRAAVTRDFLPKLHNPAPGLFEGVGCNGRGVAMTTALGAVMSDLALGADPSEAPVPIETETPHRFHAVMRHGPRAYVLVGRWQDRQRKRKPVAKIATSADGH